MNDDELHTVSARRSRMSGSYVSPSSSGPLPGNKRGKASGALASPAWTVRDGSTHIVQANTQRLVEGKSLFAFDAVYDQTASTADLYEGIVRPVLTGVLCGKHGTVFAYGQTGSGKTYTMQGTPEAHGIIQLAAQDMFGRIQQQQQQEQTTELQHINSYRVTVSYFEIYNETVRDLLASEVAPVQRTRSRSPTSDALLQTAKLPTVAIRNDPKRGGICVDAFTTEVSTAEALVELLQRGNRNRSTASTEQNDQSSRSHAVFRVVIESRDGALSNGLNNGAATNKVRLSTLNFVDLAGSEKGQKTSASPRQRESGKINQR